MNSFVVPKEAVADEKIIIEETSDINHIRNVLRLDAGDKVRVVDGEYEYICEITNVGKKEVILKIAEKKGDAYSLETEIDAAIGIIKNDKMDLIIQKLTEIGINKIIPMITKRAVVKIDEKKEKWDKISKEAQKQCRGVKSLVIGEPLKLADIEFDKYDLVLVPYEKEESKGIFEILKSIEKPKKILYLIGPEGGFAEEEIEMIIKMNGKAVTLGKRILRAETAAIVTGGIIANVFE